MNEPRSVAIIGFLAAGALILTLGFCLGGRSGADGRTGSLPSLRIHEPADGDSLGNPVVLTFSTRAQLRLDPQRGWTAGELHLHAMADSLEIMPAAADIAPMGENSWQWRLPPLEPGSRRLYLTWAGRHHGNLPGDTDTIRLFILP